MSPALWVLRSERVKEQGRVQWALLGLLLGPRGRCSKATHPPMHSAVPQQWPWACFLICAVGLMTPVSRPTVRPEVSS